MRFDGAPVAVVDSSRARRPGRLPPLMRALDTGGKGTDTVVEPISESMSAVQIIDKDKIFQ